MSTRILCRIDHTLCYLITLLFWLKSRFDTVDPRLLIQLSLKTWLLLREPFDFLPSVAQRRTPIGISEVALRLLLIAVAFYTSRGVCFFASGPQIPAGGFGLEHISTHNFPLLFSACRNPVAIFPSPSRRSNHSSWPAKTTEASARQRKSRKRIRR